MADYSPGSSISSLSFLDTSSSSQTSYLSPDLSSEDLSFDTSAALDEEHSSCFPEPLQEPLYEGCNLTILDSYILLLQFSLRHSLTKKAFSDLTHLIESHLPEGANCAKSVHQIKQLFGNAFHELAAKKHYFCGVCTSKVTGTSCPGKYCSNAGVEEFVHIPVMPQLKRKLEGPSLWALIQRRFHRPSKSGVISDIYNGTEYSKYTQPGGFLSEDNPANLSLLMNTDGVSLYKSSSRSLWPVWLVINELPPALRFSKQHMLLAGLWYGEHKPNMGTYLEPLIESLNQLYYQGIVVSTSSGEMTCKAMMLLSSLDLQARAVVSHMKQFNGKSSCTLCTDEGAPNPSCVLVRWWPYNNRLQLRSHQLQLRNAQQSAQEQQTVQGVMGYSILAMHKPFDLVKGFVIDVLHCVFKGVVPNLVSYWFGDSYKNRDFNIRDKIHLCQERLSKIQVPDFISRTPGKLRDHSHWKASEVRSWLLYYSMPIICDVLPQPYLNHYALLVASMHILLSDNITQDALGVANRLMEKFCCQVEDLYGISRCTMNVHLHRHLCLCVKWWGPLWSYSCFPFEGMNNHIKSFFHGTRDMSMELAFSYTMTQLLPTLKETIASSERRTIELARIQPLGLPKKMVIDDDIVQQCCQLGLVMEPETMYPVFHRVSHGAVILCSRNYTRATKRNSYTVVYTAAREYKLGSVEFYVMVEGHLLAVVECLQRTVPPYTVQVACAHQLNCVIIPVRRHNSRTVIPADSIVCKCVFVAVDSNNYCCMQPNSLLFD